MQKVRVAGSFVLLVISPAGFSTCEDHQPTSEHRQEMVRFLAVHHAHLQHTHYTYTVSTLSAAWISGCHVSLWLAHFP